jgi:hypothetical protein
VSAARYQFPKKAKAIEDLASRKQEFGEICRGFGVAKAELEKWGPIRNEMSPVANTVP